MNECMHVCVCALDFLGSCQLGSLPSPSLGKKQGLQERGRNRRLQEPQERETSGDCQACKMKESEKICEERGHCKIRYFRCAEYTPLTTNPDTTPGCDGTIWQLL